MAGTIGLEYEFTSSFSPEDIDRPSIIVVIADKNVGKTTLAIDLIMAFHETLYLDMAVPITMSDDPSYFANIVEEKLVIRKQNPVDVAKRLMKCQKDVQKSHEASVPRLGVVFDNVFFATTEFKGMNDFFENSSNRNILSIFTTSDPSIMPRQLLHRCDYVFVARSMSFGTRKKSWSTFGDMFEKFEDFNDALSHLGPHSFLVINKNSRLKDLTDIVSTYTPTVYLAKPITYASANAFGKWHLLDGKFEEAEAAKTLQTFDPDLVPEEAGEVKVKEHSVFKITDPRMRIVFFNSMDILD